MGAFEFVSFSLFIVNERQFLFVFFNYLEKIVLFILKIIVNFPLTLSVFSLKDCSVKNARFFPKVVFSKSLRKFVRSVINESFFQVCMNNFKSFFFSFKKIISMNDPTTSC